MWPDFKLDGVGGDSCDGECGLRLRRTDLQDKGLRDDFTATLPRKRMGAGVLLSHSRGRVLLVEPTYKPDWEITPREVKTKLDQKASNFVLIDVREPNEYDITHIVDKEKLFPRAAWTQIAAKLKGHENDEVAIHCKSGGRSLQVAQILRQQGIKNAKSMAGGILLWNRDVNAGGPQY